MNTITRRTFTGGAALLPALHFLAGGLTLYFQNESPGADKEANWLPAMPGTALGSPTSSPPVKVPSIPVNPSDIENVKKVSSHRRG